MEIYKIFITIIWLGFFAYGYEEYSQNIKILPDQDIEVFVKPFKIHHLLISKTALKPDTYYRLVVSFHGAVFLLKHNLKGVH